MSLVIIRQFLAARIRRYCAARAGGMESIVMWVKGFACLQAVLKAATMSTACGESRLANLGLVAQLDD
jgi:hypothetical protein